MSGPAAGDTLVAAALKVLLQPDPWVKAEHTKKAVALWHAGAINQVAAGTEESARVPDRPSRADDKVKLVSPGAMPKLGKGGTLASRQAILHSLVHIENWAIDLSWDIIARFGSDPSYSLPREFFNDFVQVAADECSHFCSLCTRLEALGSHYGALPAHDGLWESASTTACSLPARLAVEHCVHEARGLDVLPSTIQKFRSGGDSESAALLENVIYPEEVSHCEAGVRWLKHLHQQAQQLQTIGSHAVQSNEALHSGHVRASGVPTELQPPQPPQQQHYRCNADSGNRHHDFSGLAGKQQQLQDQVIRRQRQQQQAIVCQADLTAQCLQQQCSATQQDNDSNHQPAQLQEAAASVAAAAAAHNCYPSWVQDALQYQTVEAWFHSLVRRHFKGRLKPPFNETARAAAGFGPEWYLPLAADAS